MRGSFVFSDWTGATDEDKGTVVVFESAVSDLVRILDWDSPSACLALSSALGVAFGATETSTAEVGFETVVDGVVTVW
jgi:hypothetical protein